MSTTEHRFRFKPRFRGLVILAMAMGALLVAVGLAGIGEAGGWLLGGGAVGLALGALYLASPVWRIEVIVDDRAIEVASPGARRFRLDWDEIVEVVASPETKTCFVNGGHAERSLLVPGPGASAPYDIDNKAALFDLICARVPKERIRTVELLEKAAKPQAPDKPA